MSRWLAVPALLCSLLPVLAFWWQQGRAVPVADAPSSQVPCVSYAPYRDGQSPFDEALVVPPEQIAEDLARLRLLTGCVRTYSVDQGLDAVPRIARDLGMTVMLGAWIGRDRQENERELAKVVDLAERYPESIRAIIVGNEVLLRREQPSAQLIAMIEKVRAAVPMLVTYADVWEFWQEHPEVAAAVDFVTIHTLPYWEDEPRPIDEAVPHVLAIWRQMSALFPGKAVFIGEAGWPSAGRMREGARPGLVEQARFIRELMIGVEPGGIGLNVIEAFDQPWKRALEGTVGGHWGLLGSDRQPKFPLQGPVSGEPDWLLLFGCSAAAALLLLAPALRSAGQLSARRLFALTCAGAVAGTLLVLGVRDGLVSSRTTGDWLVLALRAASAAVAAGQVLEALAARQRRRFALSIFQLLQAVRRRQFPDASWRDTILGVARATALFGAAASALCLLFDPRYRDFATPLMALPGLAFLVLALAGRRRDVAMHLRADIAEERLLAGVLALAALAVAVLEGFANHQALAWAGGALLLAAAVALDPGEPRAVQRHRRSRAIAPSNAPPAESAGA